MYKNLNAESLGITARQNELIELALTYKFRGLDIDTQSFLRQVESRGKEHAVRFLQSAHIRVGGFDLPVRWLADDVAWFDFPALCDGPRSQNDYIELAMEFHAVLISNVPCFDHMDDQARRFINLVDEFYDRNVKLVLSAEVALEQLYRAGRLGFEFERTCSRLLEMQSHDYLAREHRP